MYSCIRPATDYAGYGDNRINREASANLIFANFNGNRPIADRLSGGGDRDFLSLGLLVGDWTRMSDLPPPIRHYGVVLGIDSRRAHPLDTWIEIAVGLVP